MAHFPPPPPGRKPSVTSKVLETLHGSKTAVKPRHVSHDDHGDDGGGGGHGGNDAIWLISYSDLMTLLFGFFVILFSMSTLDKKKFETVRKGTAEKFGGQYQNATETASREIKAQIKQADAAVVEGLEVTETEEGLEMNFKGQSLFLSGSAELSPEAIKFMTKTAQSLIKFNNDYLIRVEGHTDDAPISTPIFPSNWELSSSRAIAVVRLFEGLGIKATQMEAIGYGASRPLRPNRNPAGQPIPENMAANRRIVLKIQKADSAMLKKVNAPPAIAPPVTAPPAKAAKSHL